MTDRLDIPVETTEGWRPDPSRGERVMVALAGLALLGGALIVGGNLLQGDEVGLASASPGETTRETATPFPTPLVTPPPRELTLVEQSPPPPASVPSLFGGWIRATVDLPIHSDADENAAVVGTLPAGGLAYADEQSVGDPELGWLTIEGPEPTGWIATRAGNQDLVTRYPPADVAVSGWFGNVAAGPTGFVAIGAPSGISSSYPAQSVFVSTDGVAWHAATEPPGADSYPAGIAWGPAGWLMVTGDADSGRSRLWSSPDGERWRSAGVLETDYPQGLAASGLGYLLQTSGGGGYASAPESWFSADGIHWTESRPGLIGNYQVTATAAGFYARTRPEWPTPANQPLAAFSTDGVSWAPSKPILFVGAVGDVLLGIDVGPTGRGGEAVRGSFYRGRLGWRTIEGGDAPFTGAVVTSLVSDGERATAFGWDATTEASLTWTSDGGPWTRRDLPASFGGPPSDAAARAGQVVVVGNRWNSRGPNPVFWHQNADGSWEPERSPVLRVAPDPSPEECGASPTDSATFVSLDRSFAVACWSDATLTIRTWSSSCEGCTGDAVGIFEEAWLAYPMRNLLFLSPVKWTGAWWATAVLAPSLASAPDPTWLEAWLELTGHFDDPAATRCHWTPPPDQAQSYGGARSIIDACRQQFVVTEVRVVDGP